MPNWAVRVRGVASVGYNDRVIMKSMLLQVAGAIILGVAGGLIAHCVTEPEDGGILRYVGLAILAVIGIYLLSGGGMRRKKVVFEFVGGFMDGKTLIGDLRSHQQGKNADEAVRHYISTDRGAVGKRFWSASDYMIDTLKTHGGDVTALRAASRDPRFQCDHYEVVERRETDNQVLVKAKYVPS